jgi:hypothetical protein
MTQTLALRGRTLDSYESLVFLLVAPKSQIRKLQFEKVMTREKVSEGITARVELYKNEPEYVDHKEWLNQWALPLVSKMELLCRDWESILSVISEADPARGAELRQFYNLCLRYNEPAGFLSTLPTHYVQTESEPQ